MPSKTPGLMFRSRVEMKRLELWRAPKMLAGLKIWARTLKRDAKAIYLARRDPRVPWYAKAVAVAAAGYALSPIDLIPDFIPVLGYLDDLIIVPLGIWLAVCLIPADVMDEYRAITTLDSGEA
jgi:uncharacterized membrane protein YkvA (DUF1232 family)